MVEYLRRVRAGYNVAAAAAAAAAAAKRSPNGSPHLKPKPCASQDLARLFATAYAAALPLDHPSVSPLHAGKGYNQRPSEQRPSVPSALWLWAPSLSNGSGRRGKSANGNGRPAPVYQPPGADLEPAHGAPPWLQRSATAVRAVRRSPGLSVRRSQAHRLDSLRCAVQARRPTRTATIVHRVGRL